MVLEHIDWPQPGCTSPSLKTVKPVMGWTQWGLDWHVPGAFGAQGCTLLRVLQGGRCPRRHPAGLACQHCMEHKHAQPCLCSVGLVTSVWRALVLLCKDSTQGCVSLPTLRGQRPCWGNRQSTAQNAAGFSGTVMGKTGNSILSYYLPHVSVALNRVSAETCGVLQRPCEPYRTYQPCANLVTTLNQPLPHLAAGYLYLLLCAKNIQIRTTVLEKKSFRYNNWWCEPTSVVASYWPVRVLDQALPCGHFQRQLFW